MIAQTRPIPTRISFRSQNNYSTVKIFDCLRGMDIFSHLEDNDLFKLIAMAHERRLEKGSVIVRENESSGDHLYVILEGEAAMTWENGNGVESLLTTLRPGDTAGETELFGSGHRYATVRAATQVRLLSLHRDDLMRMLREKPELVLDFLGEMARRLSQSHKRVAGVCNQRVPRRIACILLSLFEEHGYRGKDPDGRNCVLLREHPTQRRIAELAGTARETVSRLFTSWENSGWFEDRDGEFRVFDEEQLHRLAGEG